MRKYKQNEVLRSKLTGAPIKISKVLKRDPYTCKDDRLYVTDLDPKNMTTLRGTGREILGDSIRRRYQ